VITLNVPCDRDCVEGAVKL